MADIKNKNELKRRTELFLDSFTHQEYLINEEFCKDTMRMMREFIGRASHLLDIKSEHIKKIQRQLKEYRNAEEQGLLLQLPCKVGDTVYEISLVEPYRNPAIRKMGVVDILIRDDDMYFTLQDLYNADYDNSILSTEFGKTVFLTEVEAEQAVQQALDKLSD